MSIANAVLRVAVVLLGCVVVCGQTSRAADTPAAKSVADAHTTADSKALREQTIYVPYDKLRNVFEQHGRGVFLPYEKFQELWQGRAKSDSPSRSIPSRRWWQ